MQSDDDFEAWHIYISGDYSRCKLYWWPATYPATTLLFTIFTQSAYYGADSDADNYKLRIFLTFFYIIFCILIDIDFPVYWAMIEARLSYIDYYCELIKAIYLLAPPALCISICFKLDEERVKVLYHQLLQITTPKHFTGQLLPHTAFLVIILDASIVSSHTSSRRASHKVPRRLYSLHAYSAFDLISFSARLYT